MIRCRTCGVVLMWVGPTHPDDFPGWWANPAVQTGQGLCERDEPDLADFHNFHEPDLPDFDDPDDVKAWLDA